MSETKLDPLKSKEGTNGEAVVAGGGVGQAVDLSERVKLYATAEAPYHDEGDETFVHPSMVRHFLSRGFVRNKKDIKPAATTPPAETPPAEPK